VPGGFRMTRALVPARVPLDQRWRGPVGRSFSDHFGPQIYYKWDRGKRQIVTGPEFVPQGLLRGGFRGLASRAGAAQVGK